MKSYDRVKAAITFSNPDKVPILRIGGGDVHVMFPMPSKSWQPGHSEDEFGLFPHVGGDFIVESGLWKWDKPDWARQDPRYEGTNWLNLPREEIDSWGCIWIRKGSNYTIGHPERPSLPDWSKLEQYLERYTPDPFDKSRYLLSINFSKKSRNEKYRGIILGGLGPLDTAANMRGFANFLVDHTRSPEKVKRLLNHLTEHTIDVMDAWIKYGGDPHGFILVEDLGTQQGPFLSPKTFEKFYKQVYESIFKAAHDRGCDIIQHCCGKVNAIMPLLIDWGLDVIEFDSPRMTGYPNLRPFRGKINMWGCVNIQSIYTQGTPEDCEREVWHMVRNLGTKDGGFGAYFYPQPTQIKVPEENIKAFARGLEKYGNYSKIPNDWWDYPVVSTWKYDVVPPLPPTRTISTQKK